MLGRKGFQATGAECTAKSKFNGAFCLARLPDAPDLLPPLTRLTQALTHPSEEESGQTGRHGGVAARSFSATIRWTRPPRLHSVLLQRMTARRSSGSP